MKNEEDNKKTSKIDEIGWKVIEKLNDNKTINKAINKANNYLNKPKSNTNKKKEYSNFVAKKFDWIIIIVKALGYTVAVITALLSLGNDYQLGLLWGVLVAIATWLISLSFEAVAEIIQKLQNIEDNTRK